MQRRLRKYMTDQGKVADTEYLFPVEDLNSRILVVEKFKRDITLNRTLPAPPTEWTVTQHTIPESVLKALRDYEKAVELMATGHETRREAIDMQWAVTHAISLAIGHIVSERDQEIIRLNTSLATERSNADRLGKLLDEIAGNILHARREGKQDG